MEGQYIYFPKTNSTSPSQHHFLYLFCLYYCLIFVLFNIIFFFCFVFFSHYTNIACLFFGFVFVCPSPSKQYKNGSRKNRPRKNRNAKALRDGEYRPLIVFTSSFCLVCVAFSWLLHVMFFCCMNNTFFFVYKLKPGDAFTYKKKKTTKIVLSREILCVYPRNTVKFTEIAAIAFVELRT